MKKGQGLLETIVAIGVILTGLVSVMTLVISNLTGAREAALRYQAVNLAREGIELVRNKRDSNWLAGIGAWVGIGNEIETIGLLIIPSQFSRTITTTSCTLQQDAQCTITSTVTWQSGGREGRMELSETLYDWR